MEVSAFKGINPFRGSCGDRRLLLRRYLTDRLFPVLQTRLLGTFLWIPRVSVPCPRLLVRRSRGLTAPAASHADGFFHRFVSVVPISGVLLRRSRGFRCGSAPAAWAPPAGVREPGIQPVSRTALAFYPHQGWAVEGDRAPSRAMSLNPHSLHSRATDEGGTPTRRGGPQVPPRSVPPVVSQRVTKPPGV